MREREREREGEKEREMERKREREPGLLGSPDKTLLYHSPK